MNIVQLFLSAAEQYPTNKAIVDLDRTITYAELKQEVENTANYFRAKGIKKGDRVLVFVPMSIDLYRIVLALFYLGATAVFLDEWVSKKRMEICCEIAECTGFIGVFKARVFGLFSKQIRRIPIKLKLQKQSKSVQKGMPVEVQYDTSSLITFTTGSTGKPKAADRTHGFLKEQFDALLDKIEPNVSDIDMPALPIVLFVNLGVGCTSVIANFKMTKPDSLNPEIIENQLEKHKVNRITASPFFIKKLAQHLIQKGTVNPSIQKMFTGGAPVFPEEAALYVKAFPKSESMIVYGSTEAEPISSILAHELIPRSSELKQGLPVGKVYRKTLIKILPISEQNIPPCSGEELNAQELPEETIGEIVVAGPHVLKRYFKNEKAFMENKVIVTDSHAPLIWHRTGDSGWIKDGQLFLTGRCKQLIKHQESYLSPFVIEGLLQSIEGINLGTLLRYNNQNILVVESAESNETLLLKMNDLKIPFDRIEIKGLIPRDPRHHSKIDYEQLKQKINI